MMKNTIKTEYKKNSLRLLAALAAIGVLLALLGGGRLFGKEEHSAYVGIQLPDPDEYAESLQRKAEELCNRIKGVSGAYAVVTLSGGFRILYASDSQSGKDSYKEQTVIVGSTGEKQGLPVGYEYPRIAGIGVVCRGGDDRTLQPTIISVLSSAFDLPSNKIFVCGA